MKEEFMVGLRRGYWDFQQESNRGSSGNMTEVFIKVGSFQSHHRPNIDLRSEICLTSLPFLSFDIRNEICWEVGSILSSVTLSGLCEC